MMKPDFDGVEPSEKIAMRILSEQRIACRFFHHVCAKQIHCFVAWPSCPELATTSALDLIQAVMDATARRAAGKWSHSRLHDETIVAKHGVLLTFISTC